MIGPVQLCTGGKIAAVPNEILQKAHSAMQIMLTHLCYLDPSNLVYTVNLEFREVYIDFISGLDFGNSLLRQF